MPGVVALDVLLKPRLYVEKFHSKSAVILNEFGSAGCKLVTIEQATENATPQAMKKLE